MTERRHGHRDRRDHQADVVHEKRVHRRKVRKVAANDTTERVGDADYRQQQTGAVRIHTLKKKKKKKSLYVTVFFFWVLTSNLAQSTR